MLYVQRGILNLHLNNADSFGDLENALTLYEKAIKNKPDNLDAIMNKAIVLCYMNRKDKALEYLKSIKIKEKQPLIDDIIISINDFDMNEIFEN
jgi:tetratricopeptide (TPR) repeat protein